MLIICAAFQCRAKALNWSHLFQLDTGADLSTVLSHGVATRACKNLGETTNVLPHNNLLYRQNMIFLLLYPWLLCVKPL